MRRTDDDRREYLALRALTTVPPAPCLRCRSDRGLHDGIPSVVERPPACPFVVRNTGCGRAWWTIRTWMRRSRTAGMQRMQCLVRGAHNWRCCSCLVFYYTVSCSQPSSEHLHKRLNTCCCVHCWVLTPSSLFVDLFPQPWQNLTRWCHLHVLQ